MQVSLDIFFFLLGFKLSVGRPIDEYSYWCRLWRAKKFICRKNYFSTFVL